MPVRMPFLSKAETAAEFTWILERKKISYEVGQGGREQEKEYHERQNAEEGGEEEFTTSGNWKGKHNSLSENDHS